NDEDAKLLEKLKTTKQALDKRYEAANAQFSATEKFIADARNELNNELEMKEMSLETKVDFLQYRPKTVRERHQKQLQADIDRLVRENKDATDAVIADFQPPGDDYEAQPIDWAPIQAKITKYQGISVEDLEASDPKQ